MSEQRCEHDFLPGQCSACKPAPLGINTNVFITKNSQAFHNDPDCAFLESGQDFAEKRGGTKQHLLFRKWDQVFANLGPCEWCCALYHSEISGIKTYCLASINGKKLKVRYLRDRYVDYGEKEFQVFDENERQIYFIDPFDVEKFF